MPGFLGIEIGTALLGLAAIIASGALADRIGRRRLLIVCAVAIAVFALVAPVLLDGGQIGEFVYMVVGSALLGFSFGQSSGARRLALQPALPLHRLGADLGSRLDVRRRLRAAGGAASSPPASGSPPRASTCCRARSARIIALLLSQRLDLRND